VKCIEVELDAAKPVAVVVGTGETGHGHVPVAFYGGVPGRIGL